MSTTPTARRVKVFHNRCRQGMGWRVKDYDTDETLQDWVKSLVIEGATFFVSQLGRRKTIESGMKLPHAWVEGLWTEGITPTVAPNSLRQVIYYPQTTRTFVTANDQVS